MVFKFHYGATVNSSISTISKFIFCCLALNIASVMALPRDVSSPRVIVPPNVITSANRPMMMLATSKDQSLFGPIYNDFEDIDGDGVLDTVFRPNFKYYGYFDPTKCYAYSATDGRFNPAAIATITTDVTPGRFTCSSSSIHWSGNFLNWSSMTRLDVVRKMLYGGKRSTDMTGTTVLERTQLNFDAHSFAKFYNGTDVRDYTPYSTTALTKATGSNAGIYAGLTVCNLGNQDNPVNTPILRMAKGNYRFWATVEHRVCQFSDLTNDADSKFTPKLARYYKDADKGGGGINHEILTPNSLLDGASYGQLLGPDLTMRVKVCDPAFIGEERCQAFPANSTTNFKPFGLLQEFGYSIDGSAARAEFGVITGSYDKNVTAGALRKNMGDFADEINSTTGVFCHNSAGSCSLTLADGRKTGNGAIKALDNFVLYGRSSLNYSNSVSGPDLKDGQLPAWGNPIGEMVVQALQYFSFDGSTPTSTNPTTNTNDNATGLPLAAWTSPLSNSNSTRTGKYGNAVCRPMYTLALSSSALSFDAQADIPFATLPNRSLGGIAAYTDLVGSEEKINGTLRSIGLAVAGSGNAGFGDSCAAKLITSLSTVSGICPEAPALGGSYQVAGAALYANTSKIRTLTASTTPPKPSDLDKVKDALKVKTLAASLSGGSARVDIRIPGSNKYVYITPESLWSGGLAGSVLTFVSISSSDTETDKHGAFIVTWNDSLYGGDHDMDLTGFLRYDLVKSASSASGWSVKVTTDIPANCGGGPGTHGFSIIGATKPGTSISADGRYLTHQHYDTKPLTNLANKAGYLCGDTNYRNASTTNAFGYDTSIYKFNGTTNKDGACYVNPLDSAGNPFPDARGYCNVKDKDFPITLTFDMLGVDNAIIKDPLWYAAKYGDFDSSLKQSDGTYLNLTLPPDQSSWDKLNADGTPGADGIPDGYYLARRPDLLEQQLRKALSDVGKSSNAAPAISSTQLFSGGIQYKTTFDTTAVDGDVTAFKLDSEGQFPSTATWSAAQLLSQPVNNPSATGYKGETRQIITNTGNSISSAVGTTGGVKFRWNFLPAAFQTQMTSDGTNKLNAINAEIALNYIRGDQTKEAASTGLRERRDNILGPIVNGTPWIQDRPRAKFLERNFAGYNAYATANNARDRLLWVAANDGMLHALNSVSGIEEFAYIPGMLANRLAEIPMQRGTTGRTRLNGGNYSLDPVEVLPQGTVFPYVDGSPYSGDVKIGSDWKTYVFSSLGRGGKGLFALDATSISKLRTAESAGTANDIFKWQFSSDDDPDLGYIVGDISLSNDSGQASPIVKLSNGKFALLVPNGQKSTSGKAVLYVIYVDGPAANGVWTQGVNYQKIIVDDTSANGLSALTWIDLNGDGTADIAYAGDLKGNLWKFDLKTLDVAYSVAGVKKPLFTASNTSKPQPITTAPSYAYAPFGGLVINFGTGISFENGDFPNTTLKQSVYGIWDRPSFSTSSNPALPSGTSTLAPLTYVLTLDGSSIATNGRGFDTTTQNGWYFNFPGASEMMLSDPILSAGILNFTGVRPDSSVDKCSNTPLSILYGIDPLTGVAERNTLGTNTLSGTTYLNAGVAIADQKIKVINDRRDFQNNRKKPKPGDPPCKIGDAECPCYPGQLSRLRTGDNTKKPLCYSPNARVQWREIPGLRTDQ